MCNQVPSVWGTDAQTIGTYAQTIGTYAPNERYLCPSDRYLSWPWNIVFVEGSGKEQAGCCISVGVVPVAAICVAIF